MLQLCYRNRDEDNFNESYESKTYNKDPSQSMYKSSTYDEPQRSSPSNEDRNIVGHGSNVSERYQSTKHCILDEDLVSNQHQSESESRHKSRPRSRRSRSRSRSCSRDIDSRKKQKKYIEKPMEEKPGNICIDDWTPKVSNLTQDPSIMSLKKKLKQREDEEEEIRRRKHEEEEENEKKKMEQQKAAQISSPPPLPPPAEPARNPVAIQWGQTTKSHKTPDKTLASKRLQAFVGKMPGRVGKKWTPEPERFFDKKSVSPQPQSPRPPTPPPIPVIEKKPATPPPLGIYTIKLFVEVTLTPV